jgi:hypothetical protein
VRQHISKKQKVGAPRRRGSQASGANAPFRLIQRRLRRASRTAAARHPYLEDYEGRFELEEGFFRQDYQD